MPDTLFYNVQLSVPLLIEAEWVRWMCDVHIPDVLAVPGFLGATMYRVEGLGVDESNGNRMYVNSYRVQDRAALEAYLSSTMALRLRADHETRFGSRVTAMRNIWEMVEKFAE